MANHEIGCGMRQPPGRGRRDGPVPLPGGDGRPRHSGPTLAVPGFHVRLGRGASGPRAPARRGDETGKDHIFRVCDEAWRVLKPGGTLEIDVPHLNGRTAFRDFTHRRFFVPMTFSHLWDGQRDPWYPRKIWSLEYCHVLQEVPYQYHMRKYLPRLTGVLEWLPISRPHNIFVKLKKV